MLIKDSIHQTVSNRPLPVGKKQERDWINER